MLSASHPSGVQSPSATVHPAEQPAMAIKQKTGERLRSLASRHHDRIADDERTADARRTESRSTE